MSRFSSLAVPLGALVVLSSACASQSRDERDDAGTDSETGSATDADTDADSDTDYDGPPIPTTCEEAEQARNSIGCEFFAADLQNNSLIDGYPYSIILSNPQPSQVAHVRIEDMRGVGGQLRVVPGFEVDLEAGGLRVFDVSCSEGCPVLDTGPNPLGEKIHIRETGRRDASAFKIVSDIPIAAYQWNTYGETMNSSDASLLLPTTALDDRYIGATWWSGHETLEDVVPPDTNGYERGAIAVVAVEDGTTVRFTPSVAVDPAADGSIPPLAASVESAPISMDAFDVVQISPAAMDADLSGTRIVADKPIAVFGLHPCANVPSPEWFACDHLEEQLLPLRAWGSDAVLARLAPRRDLTAADDQPVWRIVAGSADMTVTFDPPVAGVGASHHFAVQGQVLEFMSPMDHFAAGTLDDPGDPEEPEAPFFAYQLMTGRYWAGGSSAYDWGDPSMVLAPPAGQYLPRYVFTTDNVFDFEYDRIIVVRKAGYAVTLDCLGDLPEDGFAAVGDSEWEVGRFEIDNPSGVAGCADGPHGIESAASFGLTVVSEDVAMSVAYPGGIGVRWINPVIVE